MTFQSIALTWKEDEEAARYLADHERRSTSEFGGSMIRRPRTPYTSLLFSQQGKAMVQRAGHVNFGMEVE